MELTSVSLITVTIRFRFEESSVLAGPGIAYSEDGHVFLQPKFATVILMSG